MQRWYPEYQTRDRDIVDYQEFTVPGCDVTFRGPSLDPFAAEESSFFTCLGAAQTYGCFYPRPYPQILAERLGLAALNLAVGGAGPGFYLQYSSLIDAMNRGRFVILQAMAARHESNSRFAADGYVEFVRDRIKGDSINSGEAWRRIMDEEPEKAAQYVTESRASWLETTRRLLDAIKVPVIFFWYSRREPDYDIDWAAIEEQTEKRKRGEYTGHFIDGLSGDFPHYVDGATARAAAEACTAQATCLSSRGMGQPILRLSTGKPIEPDDYKGKGPEYQALFTGKNDYYPSAEMHEDAADALEPVIRQIITPAP